MDFCPLRADFEALAKKLELHSRRLAVLDGNGFDTEGGTSGKIGGIVGKIMLMVEKQDKRMSQIYAMMWVGIGAILSSSGPNSWLWKAIEKVAQFTR